MLVSAHDDCNFIVICCLFFLLDRASRMGESGRLVDACQTLVGPVMGHEERENSRAVLQVISDN